jgi:serine/threonine-protein kinase
MPGHAGLTCSSCGEALNAPSRYCPGCGSVLEAERATATAGTETVRDAGAPPPRPGRRSATSSDSLDHGRFVPGTLLLGRYRVLGLLGRGGMGEVYRADDLKLEQTVALKFLPPDLARDAGRLARFHNEVRLARQVSHASVVRVYDIAEWEGQAFLSMEYVDGEDLSSLLRRIGRLPADKATEVARQICAGLAAAHDRGVVHRDLKPGNIMIDGRGRAHITDFGLASLVDAGDDAPRAGTPAYMAPEQIRGSDVGPKSDLYALGLVLYELYTGRPAFRGDSREELARSRESGPPPPSSVVEGLDPAVERAIQRCLEEDPGLRPATALTVAASLPGGNPLAMALAAGETPSPEMVAAAGETGGMRPALVAVCLATIVATLLGAALLAPSRSITDLARPPKSPEVLLDRAHEVLRTIGYPDSPADSSMSFGWHRTWLEDIEKHDQSPKRWARLAASFPPAIYFYYRQSPDALRPVNLHGQVGETDPPPMRPGMAEISLTPDGRMWRFDAVPAQNDPEGGPPSPVDWAPFFQVAGLDPAAFRPVAPRWVPQEYADLRQAWEGTAPEASEIPLRVEAAACHGKGVTFSLIFPWTRPLRATPLQTGKWESLSQRIILSFVISTLVACGVLARRNLREGRGDRRGAFRLAAFIVLMTLVRSLCAAHHFAGISEEWNLLVRLIAAGLFNGAQAWLLYIAIEPFARRHWPDRIVAWTRLLAGRLSDPLVGRDLLVGTAFGSLMFLIDRGQFALPAWLGRPAAMPDVWELDALGGLRDWVAPAGEAILTAVEQALVVLVLLVIARILFRRPWIAASTVGTLAWVVFSTSAWGRTGGALALVSGAVLAVLIVGVALRHGLLALCAMLLIDTLLGSLGLTSDWGAWYARPGLLALLLVLALTVFAARAALAGRSLFALRLAEA